MTLLCQSYITLYQVYSSFRDVASEDALKLKEQLDILWHKMSKDEQIYAATATASNTLAWKLTDRD